MVYSLNVILTIQHSLELKFFIEDAILFVEKTIRLTFLAVRKFFWLHQRSRAPGRFHFFVATDNPELAGLALQLGAPRISRNGWMWNPGAPKKWDHMA